MSESTASITRNDIVTAIRNHAQYALTGTLETDQQSLVDLAIKLGENMFYRGTRLPGEETIHRWSFLQPETTQTFTADDYDYTLPDGFGGFADSYLNYSDTNAPHRVQVIGIDDLRALQSTNSPVSVEWPTHVAVNLKSRAQSTGQRFEMIVYPTPSAAKTLIITYYYNPNLMVDTTAIYPLGGQPHGLALMEACLAAWEIHIEHTTGGPHYAEFMRLMFDSVAFDRAMTTKKYFGTTNRPRGVGVYQRHAARGIEYLGMS